MRHTPFPSAFATGLIACAILLAGRTSLAADSNSVRRFAMIVGFNAGRPGLKPLSYADDDAIQNAELLSQLGVYTVVLSQLDAATQATHAVWVQSHAFALPTKANVLEKLDEIFKLARAAHDQGHRVEFYFWFAGHGGPEGTEGALYLLDGSFTRTDLYEHLLSKSPADFNHLIIDACDAYTFVSSRGPTDAELNARGNAYIDAQTLDRYPNTGVVLASSASSPTHEWSEYQGGVFSYEVRSALFGGADVRTDQKVTYSELEAFIEASNARVQHAKAKLHVYIRPPAADYAHVLADWVGVPGGRLAFGPSMADHFWLEDDRGLRLLDINKTSEARVVVVLPARPRYVVHAGELEYPFAADRDAVIELEKLRAVATRSSARGETIEEAFEHLFEQPFGLALYEGFCLRVGALCDPPMPDMSGGSHRVQSPVGLSPAYFVLIGAAAAAGASIAFYEESRDAYNHYLNATSAGDKGAWQSKTQTWDWATTISLGATAAAGAVGVGWLVFNWISPRPGVGPGMQFSAIGPRVFPNGAGVQVAGQF